MCIYYNISLVFPQIDKRFRQIRRKINTHILCPIIFFSENGAVYETMWKNTAQPDRPQMTIQYGACALHVE
jgi:hypothetical protein